MLMIQITKLSANGRYDFSLLCKETFLSFQQSDQPYVRACCHCFPKLGAWTDCQTQEVHLYVTHKLF